MALFNLARKTELYCWFTGEFKPLFAKIRDPSRKPLDQLLKEMEQNPTMPQNTKQLNLFG